MFSVSQNGAQPWTAGFSSTSGLLFTSPRLLMILDTRDVAGVQEAEWISLLTG